jgi:SAM-dependent methyltransferase
VAIDRLLSAIVTTNSREAALSFGAAADHYDAIRPTYPDDAIRWSLGDAVVKASTPRAHVVDLGAGTGLLTRVMVTVTDAIVTPVEPDSRMRARLAEKTPGVIPIAGTAESIPFPDGSVDAVLAGQAYHWFDREKAHAEIGRVVRVGGIFAPIWNIRDESVGWLAEYTRLVDDGGQHGGPLSDPDFGSLFGPVESKTFRHSVLMNADRLVALLASRSYFLTATPERQAELTTNVRALADSLPETFEMPYVTYCYRAVRLNDGASR